jgi:UDP-2,3-diacylglucosamine pyrophosphatase LpxH
MPAGKILVISDLHMGAGALDDFEPEIEQHFISFLKHWAPRGPVELVINGDMLDFVQAPPYVGSQLEGETNKHVPLCFTEDQSREKLKAICHAHNESLRALTHFLRFEGNTLTILPGNHDADLYWHSVRDTLIDIISDNTPQLRSRINVVLERVYLPQSRLDIHIEHGHQFDPLNSFFVQSKSCWSEADPPIRADRHGVPRLLECVGTRFLIRYLNSLDAEYPYVDNVKPFSKFLTLFGASALVPGRGPLKAAIAVTAMLRFCATTLIQRPHDLLGLDAQTIPNGTDVLRDTYSASDPQRQGEFQKQLRNSGYSDSTPLDLALADPIQSEALLEHLSSHLELTELLNNEDQGQTLELGQGFATNETNQLVEGAKSIVNAEVNRCSTVIMGHTHEAVITDNYLNTGSWTRYYRDNGQPMHPWSILKSRSYEHFPYQLNYALIQRDSGKAVLEAFLQGDE